MNSIGSVQSSSHAGGDPGIAKRRNFRCGICDKDYSRADHLSRHLHDSVPPLSCNICGKGFARADLLKRHRNIHEGVNGIGHQRTTRGSTRAVKACTRCSAKKLRCEGGQPCNRCRKKGITCEYTPFPRNHHPRQAPALVDSQLNGDEAVGQAEHIVEETLLRNDEDEMIQLQPGPEPLGGNFDSLGEFMESILLPDQASHRPSAPNAGTFTPKDFLHFGNDMGFGLQDASNFFMDPFPAILPQFAPSPTDGHDSDVLSTSAQAGADAFKKSFWCWAPRFREQTFGGVDSLQTPVSVVSHEEFSLIQSLHPSIQVDQQTRDHIMIILSDAFQGSTANTPSLSSFPSAKILTQLLRLSFIHDTTGLDNWIRLDMESAELPKRLLTIALIANGASRSHLPAVHIFGLTLQEALRIKMYAIYDSDNSLGRDLSMLQTQTLSMYAGLWSGHSRSIELAESFLRVPVTMLRRAGKFRAAQSSIEPVNDTGNDTQLNKRWNRWRSEEAYRRLVIQLFSLDSHMSMALLVNPLISGSEMHTPLPYPKRLWTATTAQEWQSENQGSLAHLPSLADCILDISNFTRVSENIDFIPSALAILYSYWALIWNYRQLVCLHNCNNNGESSINLLMVIPRKHELVEMLNRFRVHVIGPSGDRERLPLCLTVELLTMYIYVSMEELQVFAGKEGSEESRRVFPRLQRWVREQDSKQSVWSAGQVLRCAKEYAPGTLRDFPAIAVYHASLTLWSYGVIYKTSTSLNDQDESPSPSQFPIDALASEESQRFLLYGQGSPFISVHPNVSVQESIDTGSEGYALLTDPRATMQVCLQILERNFDVQGGDEAARQPALVANLCQLMRDLSRAAEFVFR